MSSSPRSRTATLERRVCPMALEAFVDDSGSSKGPIFVLGGFISSSDRWQKFEDAWAETLAESPSIKYYKNSQAMSRKDEFDGWSYTEVQTKVSRLIKVIVQYATYRISVSISHDEFHKYMSSKDILAMTDPYYILFLSLVGMSILYFDKQRERSTISFIFDEHGRIGQNAAEMMETIMKSIRMHFTENQMELLAGIPTFADDKKMTQLQAADLYAGNYEGFILTRVNYICLASAHARA